MKVKWDSAFIMISGLIEILIGLMAILVLVVDFVLRLPNNSTWADLPVLIVWSFYLFLGIGMLSRKAFAWYLHLWVLPIIAVVTAATHFYKKTPSSLTFWAFFNLVFMILTLLQSGPRHEFRLRKD